jgi:hypothetical protein
MTVTFVQFVEEVYVQGLVVPSAVLEGAVEQPEVQGTTLELTVLVLRNSSHLPSPTVIGPRDRC